MLQKMEATSRANEQGKLTPNWEGPYRIYEEVRSGTYCLETPDGRQLARTWNVDNLKNYYF